MKSYEYQLLDVFTDRLFGGNPLAVFTDARGLPDSAMQSIARELNLSETTFVLPARDPSHHYWVRIFTPLTELPTAGHPTIGTAFALALEERIRKEQERQRVIFEEGVGPVSVTIQAPMITMQQPLPEYGTVFAQRDAIAALLGLESERLHPDLPVQSVSCGIPYLIVPLSDMRAIQAIRFRNDIWDRMLRRSPHPHILVFTLETHYPHSTAHCRMFAPAFGVPEDPATGSAACPLGAYLVRHGLTPRRPRVNLVHEQGIELGRPSFLNVFIDLQGNEITSLRVGGQCVAVGRGQIHVEA